MSEDKRTITIFGYPLRDWVILITLLGSTATGGVILGGTPEQTTEAINEQTATLVKEIRSMREELRINAQLDQRQSIRIGNIEDTVKESNSRLDSIYGTLMVGLQNLDGYFRGRLDQIRQEPPVSTN